jgi:hypothetical protein
MYHLTDGGTIRLITSFMVTVATLGPVASWIDRLSNVAHIARPDPVCKQQPEAFLGVFYRGLKVGEVASIWVFEEFTTTH